jgi:hypothetical protein
MINQEQTPNPKKNRKVILVLALICVVSVSANILFIASKIALPSFPTPVSSYILGTVVRIHDTTQGNFPFSYIYYIQPQNGTSEMGIQIWTITAPFDSNDDSYNVQYLYQQFNLGDTVNMQFQNGQLVSVNLYSIGS